MEISGGFFADENRGKAGCADIPAFLVLQKYEKGRSVI